MQELAIADLLHGPECRGKIFPIVCEGRRPYSHLRQADRRIGVRPEVVIEAPTHQDRVERTQQREPVRLRKLREERLAVPQVEGK
jgi:hypothetical protein